MSQAIRVTPEQLGQASTKLTELSQSYTTIYRQLLQEASAMGTAWEGSDNLAFVSQINGCCDDLSKMAKKMEIAGEALGKQKVNYETRQQDNVTQVKRL